MSLDAILATTPGEFIKGGFTATVTGAKAMQTKSGKTMFKATLEDAGIKVHAASFSRTFEHFEGQRVQFSGMGLKRGDDYNGTPQVTIGDKAVWKPVSGAAPAPVATNTPAAPQNAVKAKETAFPGTSGAIYEGVSVGHALNLAANLIIEAGLVREGVDWWGHLHDFAGRILVISDQLKAGKLKGAPSRIPTPPAPQAQQQDNEDEPPF